MQHSLPSDGEEFLQDNFDVQIRLAKHDKRKKLCSSKKNVIIRAARTNIRLPEVFCFCSNHNFLHQTNKQTHTSRNKNRSYTYTYSHAHVHVPFHSKFTQEHMILFLFVFLFAFRIDREPSKLCVTIITISRLFWCLNHLLLTKPKD